MSKGKSLHVIRGAFISMVVLIFQMFAALLKVRVILSHYGHEYYSIFQSSNGIFSYLILIESGFSVAYLLKMYEPYAHHNFEKVQQLYLGLEKMLHKVAGIMLIGVVAITAIYPLIVAENSLNKWEIIILIALCGLKFVLPYFFTVAKKQILNVVEKSYLTSIIDSFFNLITDIIVIMIAYFTDWSFLAVAFVSVLMLIPSIILYTVIINKYKTQFGFKRSIEPSYEASGMTKDIMAQKIAYLADNNIDQIILSTRNLLQTTIYTSFNSVVSYPVSLVNQLISAFRGHMGVRLADDADESFRIFRKLLSVNYYIAAVISCVFILQAQSFIKLWIGETYNTEGVTIILFAVLLFRKCGENTITIAREGRDLYKESKKYAIIAAITNLVFSLILVQFIEIKGLLVATLIADLVVLDFNNYRLVFSKIFAKKIDIWKELLPTSMGIIVCIYTRFFSIYSTINQDSWISFVFCSIISTVVVALFMGFGYLIFSEYMRGIVRTIVHKRA